MIDFASRLKYELQVRTYLTFGNGYTRDDHAARSSLMPVLNESEMDEMRNAYAEGIPARDFAQTLAARDEAEMTRTA